MLSALNKYKNTADDIYMIPINLLFCIYFLLLNELNAQTTHMIEYSFITLTCFDTSVPSSGTSYTKFYN
jgi:hypothetical protein